MVTTSAAKDICPHCKSEVDKTASRCPHCQGKIYRWTLGRKILAGALGALVFFVIVSLNTSSSTSSTTAQSPEQAAKQAAELAEWQKSPAGKLCAKHTDWKRPACDAIVQKKVAIGMSEDQARAAWGTPDDINRTTTTGGTHEQWVYGSNYIYFDNGILSSIQN